VSAMTQRAVGLDRFHVAHARQGAYARARSEIVAGRKRTHWMWFVFPQLRVLAKSETAQHYGLADKAEAAAYIGDPVLRARLAECTMGVLSHRRLMFSYPDNYKLHACMTLFSTVVADPTLPNAVLDRFYDGRPHQLTLDVLDGKPIAPQMKKVQVVHWERRVADARANVAVSARQPRTAPLTRDEVAAFIEGFGLPASATKRLVAGWLADQERARQTGWDAHADAARYDES